MVFCQGRGFIVWLAGRVVVGVRASLVILCIRCVLNAGYLGWLFGGFADRSCTAKQEALHKALIADLLPGKDLFGTRVGDQVRAKQNDIRLDLDDLDEALDP